MKMTRRYKPIMNQFQGEFLIACHSKSLYDIHRVISRHKGLDIGMFGNKGFLFACQNSLHIVKWFLRKNPNMIVAQEALEIACMSGKLDIAKFLHARDHTLTSDFHKVMEHCAKTGNQEIAQWIYGNHFYELKNNDYEFATHACIYNQLDILKWYSHLVILPLDKVILIFEAACYKGYIDICMWIHGQYQMDFEGAEYIFRRVCYNGHIQTAMWLYSVWKDIDILNEDENFIENVNQECSDEMIEWISIIVNPTRKLFDNAPQKSWPPKEEDDQCSICYSETPDHETQCGHRYCGECLQKWLKRSVKCPYCRQKVTGLNKKSDTCIDQ